MKIDEAEFLETAKVVVKMQKKLGNFDKDQAGVLESPETFCNWMISLAYSYCNRVGYFSTGGIILSSFIGPEGELTVKSSVMSYLALKYLEALEKEFKL